MINLSLYVSIFFSCFKGAYFCNILKDSKDQSVPHKLSKGAARTHCCKTCLQRVLPWNESSDMSMPDADPPTVQPLQQTTKTPQPPSQEHVPHHNGRQNRSVPCRHTRCRGLLRGGERARQQLPSRGAVAGPHVVSVGSGRQGASHSWRRSERIDAASRRCSTKLKRGTRLWYQFCFFQRRKHLFFS
jgi:hypothetical protein